MQSSSNFIQHNNSLREPCPELSPNRSRSLDTPNCLIVVYAPRINIRLQRTNELSPHDNLVSNIHHDKQQDANIGNEEIGGVPWNECRESLGDNDKDVEEQAVPGEERLPHRLVRQGITRDVSCSERSHECNVTAIDASPSDEASNGSDVQQPIKDLPTILGEIEEGEEPESGGESNSDVWDALGRCSLEESWG